MFHRLEAALASLVGAEAGRLLARCGLAELLERLRLYGRAGGALAASPRQPGEQEQVRLACEGLGPW